MANRRSSSKVLLVDERRRVLLFRGIDRTKPDVPPWWFPVGGSLEPGETPHEAAIRETREETGLVIRDPGPIVFPPLHLGLRGPAVRSRGVVLPGPNFPEGLPDELERLPAD